MGDPLPCRWSVRSEGRGKREEGKGKRRWFPYRLCRSRGILPPRSSIVDLATRPSIRLQCAFVDGERRGRQSSTIKPIVSPFLDGERGGRGIARESLRGTDMILTTHGNRRVLCTSVKIMSGGVREVAVRAIPRPKRALRWGHTPCLLRCRIGD